MNHKSRDILTGNKFPGIFKDIEILASSNQLVFSVRKSRGRDLHKRLFGRVPPYELVKFYALKDSSKQPHTYILGLILLRTSLSIANEDEIFL